MASAGALAGPLVARTFDKLHFKTLCLGVVAVNVVNFFIGSMLWEEVKPEVKDRKAIQVEQDADSSEGADKTISEQVSTMFANRAACGLLLVSFIYALGFAIGDGPEMVFFKDRFGFTKEKARRTAQLDPCHFLAHNVLKPCIPLLHSWQPSIQYCEL